MITNVPLYQDNNQTGMHLVNLWFLRFSRASGNPDISEKV